MGAKQPDTTKAAQIQADAARYAAEQQSATTREALALQEKMFGQQQDYLREQDTYNKGLTLQNQANYQPYIDSGKLGLNQLTGAITDPSSWLNEKFTGEGLENDAGYKFRLAQGQNSLNNSLAAGSGLLSGAALKAMSNYNQGMASDEFNNAYSRFENSKANRYNQLSGLANMGLAGANGFAGGSAATNTGSQMAQIAGNYGNTVSGINQSNTNALNNISLANAQQQAQYALGTGGTNRTAGLLGGAASGAAMGTAVMPGIGTAVGGIIGGLASLL